LIDLYYYWTTPNGHVAEESKSILFRQTAAIAAR
jgi:hypothetical protein